MVEFFKSEFDYFKPEPIQQQVVRSFDREFSPISTIQHGVPIEFNIPGTDFLYLDLSRSELYVRAKICQPDGTPIAGAAKVGPINLTLHSLFSNIDVELCGKVISDSNTGLYPYRAILETLLTYGKDAQETHLLSSLFVKDTAGRMEEMDPVAGNPNAGYAARTLVFDASREVELTGGLHLDIFRQPRAIPSRCPLKIRLIPSKDTFVLNHTGLGYAPQIRILDAKLRIHTLEVSGSLAEAHVHMLRATNIRLPIKRIMGKTLSIPTGNTQYHHENLFSGQLPERMIMVMVDDAAYTGAYARNPFNFKNYNINQMVAYVNGVAVPSRPYQPNFANKHYIREYNALFENMGMMYSDKPINITPQEFLDGYTIWPLDLTADMCAGVSFSTPKIGSVSIEIKFGTATPNTVQLICLASFPALIEIDQHRNIIGP